MHCMAFYADRDISGLNVNRPTDQVFVTEQLFDSVFGRILFLFRDMKIELFALIFYGQITLRYGFAFMGNYCVNHMSPYSQLLRGYP